MKEIIESTLADVQTQIEEARAKLNQLLGAEAGFKLVVKQQKEAEEAAEEASVAKPIPPDEINNDSARKVKRKS